MTEGNYQMSKTFSDIQKIIADNGIKMIDFKMVDIKGQYRHVTVPAEHFDEEMIEQGIGFDASNYGYAVVEKSDMVFIPDLDTAFIDPFCDIPTLTICGDAMIIDSPKHRPLAQYPRNIIKSATEYMKSTGIADEMLILPEFEFYLFDHVGWEVNPNRIALDLDANQSYWNSAFQGLGHIVPKQKAYHIAKPYDTSYECRSKMCMYIEEAGIPVKYHHPEVAASGQFEIEPMLGEVTKMADATMMIKYIIKNTAAQFGKSATLMPKPVYGEAGSGMHVHIILMKDGESVFSDDNGYSHLSETAHYFIGGLLKHIASLCAITNPSTNSFKRLVPGYEAPVTVGYATSNRSAVIRIPAYAKQPNERRFELRNPDATCNPYFCYAAILMAGLDGIKNKINPHANGWGPYDFNLYNLPEEEKKKLTGLPTNLEDALDALEKDNDYLTAGGVFPKELIDNLIKITREEARQISQVPHPAEFEKYYNL
jgi:glutamine synthetase